MARFQLSTQDCDPERMNDFPDFIQHFGPTLIAALRLLRDVLHERKAKKTASQEGREGASK